MSTRIASRPWVVIPFAPKISGNKKPADFGGSTCPVWGGYPNRSLMLQSRSVTPAAIAGVRFIREGIRQKL
jgi:hypothetical protein